MSFTGSCVAWAKLQGVLKKAHRLPAQNAVNVVPSLKNVLAMVNYYVIGIFRDAPHPFRKTVVQKHNPLQRLAYLALLAFISPLIWVSGLLYLFYGDWQSLGINQYLSLESVAAS